MIPVRRAGHTAHERKTWADIVEMYRKGELTPRDEVMLPGQKDWVRLSDTPLTHASDTEEESRAADTNAEFDSQDHSDRARVEYTELIERMRGERVTIEMLIEAGDLAAEAGDMEAARRHFQEALDLEPFHGRTRQAIRRRFTTEAERREFRNMERPPAVWDDLGSLLNYPFARGPLYLAVPAGVVLLLSFIPMGKFVAGMLLFLWGYQIVGDVVRGEDVPPLWHRALADPLREIVLPAVAALVVMAEYGCFFGGLGLLGLTVEGKDLLVTEYIARSPFMLVFIFLTLITTLPAVITLIAFRDNPFTVLLPQNVFRTAMALGSEYAITLFLILAISFPIALLEIMIGFVPVLSNLIGAVLVTVVTPMVGMMLATMLVRNEHALFNLR